MILLTGGSGFIGRNLKEYLDDVLAPSSKELDLTSKESILTYFMENDIDIIIHSAIRWDFECDMKMFFNLVHTGKRIIYFGTGAEYRDDQYGQAKGIMYDYTLKTNNILNLRLYGCFGKYERENRFITTCITAKKNNTVVHIRENTKFSYVYIKDLCKIVEECLIKAWHRPSYTITGDRPYKLSEIAEIVGCKYEILKDTGTNYCADSDYEFNYTPLREAIKDYEKTCF